MPTTRPRYTVTDTGEMESMLDLAQERWPAVTDRRLLLLRLADVGAEQIASELDRSAAQARRRRQREALGRSHRLIDLEMLLGDTAWR